MLQNSPISSVQFLSFTKYLYLATLDLSCSMWDLTRDRTQALCIGAESLSLDHQGSPYSHWVFHSFTK